MPALHADVLAMIRREGHRSLFYASFLKPLTLWTMQVNSGALARGETTIPFNTGAGSHWAAIEPYQQIWIGTTQGDNNIEHRVRVRSISSGDGGVTGTIEVSPNVIVWADDMWIAIIHNYPLMPMYSLLLGDESIAIDRDVAYTDQNSQPPPVVVVDFSHRAGFVRHGECVFWVDASDSYAIAEGATISTYALGAYPSVDTAISFNTSTGIGYFRTESLTQDYYWLKFTVTDSNGKSQDSWRCVFAYDPDRDGGSNYPMIDFTINQLNGEFNRGGWYAQIIAHDNAALSDIPDKTFSILWREQSWGIDEDFADSIRVGSQLFVNPKIYYSTAPNGANCDVTVYFTSGVMEDGKPAPDTTPVNIDIYLVGDAPTPLGSATSGGKVTISTTFVNKACSGTIVVENQANTIELVRRTYMRGTTSETADYPANLLAFPQPLLIGYLRNENIQRSLAPRGGHSLDTFSITTIEQLLQNEYAYSVPVEAIQGTPSDWHEYEEWLTIGRILHHLYRWHSTLFQVADVRGLMDNQVHRYAADFSAGSLYSMGDQLAYTNGIRSHLVTTKKGQFCLVEDIQLMQDADRAALDIKATMSFEDGAAELGLLRDVPYKVALVYASGMNFLETFHISTEVETAGLLVPDVNAYCSLAPGAMAGGEGEKAINIERQTIVSQNEMNAVAGRYFAKENNLYPELRWQYFGDYINVIDFWPVEFWEIDINTVDTVREIAIPDLNLIFRSAAVRFPVLTGAMEINATFEPESAGLDGVTTDCPEPTDLGGTPPVIDINLLPGAIITASS